MNVNQMTAMKSYPLVTKCLQGMKGLTESEASAYFHLCRKKDFSVNDVKKIMNKVGDTKKSRSSAYNVVEKFEREGLIFTYENSSKKQTYKATHPRTLLSELQTSLNKIEPEIAELEESYEISDFDKKDPRDSARTLRSESEITTICNVLHKDSDIIIIHTDDPIMTKFIQKFEDWGASQKGNINVILFKKKSGEKGIIQLAKRPVEGGEFRIYGSKFNDDETYEYFYKTEVEACKKKKK